MKTEEIIKFLQKFFGKELEQLYPPGSFSGLFMLWPGFWWSLIKQKIKNSKGKK